MKKFMKSKIFLAIVSIALVSSVIMAGTYSWFVSTNAGDNEFAVGATAEIKAATFSIDQGDGGFSLEITNFIENIILGENVTADNIKDWTARPTGVVENDGVVENLYPSEGVRLALTIDDTADFTIKNDQRDVVVRLDFNSLEEALIGFNEDDDDDLYYVNVNIALPDDIADVVKGEDGMYYMYISANDNGTDLNIANYLDEVTIDIGYYGDDRGGIDGNKAWADNYMSNDDYTYVLNITGDNDENLTIGVVAVQATKAAVADVFGDDIAAEFWS